MASEPFEIKTVKPTPPDKEEIVFPDPATERRNKYQQKVRDCPKCGKDIVRKFT